MNQFEKAERLAALHSGPMFVIPNPWDAGSARICAALGAQALATTSAGVAFGLGRRDGEATVTRAEALANATAIVAAVDLPVTADLENGYGHRPEDAAATIQEAAETGLVGGSIEDATGDASHPIYDFNLAVEKVAAGVEAARALPFRFAFIARAENFLHGVTDLDDTIRRLVAYEAAGADMLFAPGLPSLDAIKTVLAAIRKPLNVVLGSKSPPYTLADLSAAGVRRVSTGSSLARAAYGGLADALRETLGAGTLTYLDRAPGYAEITAMMGSRA